MAVQRKPPPTVLLHGEAKIGKTTLMSKLLQGALYVQTKEDVTAPVKVIMDDPPAGWEPPRKIVTITQQGLVSPEGEVLMPGAWAAFVWLLNEYVNGKYQNYRALVVDESNTMLDYIFADMQAGGTFVSRGGKQNAFAVYGGVAELVRFLLSVPGRTNRPLGMVAHTGAAQLFEEGPMAGKFKAKAGPKAPSANISKEIVANATIVGRLVLALGKDQKASLSASEMDEVYTRMMLTGAHPLYEQGSRESRLPPVVNIETTDLHKMLVDFGWPL